MLDRSNCALGCLFCNRSQKVLKQTYIQTLRAMHGMFASLPILLPFESSVDELLVLHTDGKAATDESDTEGLGEIAS